MGNTDCGRLYSRRDMLRMAAAGCGLILLGGVSMPSEAWAAGPKRGLENGIYEVLAYKDQSYRFVTWAGGTERGSHATLDVGTYSKSDLGADRYWAFLHVSDSIQDNQFMVQNWYSLGWLRWTGEEANCGKVQTTPWVNDAHSYWYLDENSDGTITIVGREWRDRGEPDYCIDSSGSLGSNAFVYQQQFETRNGRYGSTNGNQKWILRKADWPFDFNPDHNDYGTNYSKGARVKSFDVKAHIGSTVLAEDHGVSDFYIADSPITGSGYYSEINGSARISLAPMTVVEFTNVKYRDGFGYLDCDIEGGKILDAAEDGSYFKVQHTDYRDCSFSINTQPKFIPPDNPTKTVKITD